MDVQAALSLHWASMPERRFSDVTAHFSFLCITILLQSLENKIMSSSATLYANLL